VVSRAKHILTIFDPNPNIFKRNTGALLLQAPLPSKIWRSSCAVSFPAGHPMLIHHIPPCMKALSAVPWPFIHVATLLKRSSHSHHRFLWVTHGNPGVGWPWRGWACTRKIAVKLTIEQGCTRCYFYPQCQQANLDMSQNQIDLSQSWVVYDIVLPTLQMIG